MTFKERMLLFLLASINFTHIMDFMIIMPLGGYLIPLFKISPQQFSLIVSSYTFTAGIVGFSAAFFVDRFNRKTVLLTGYSGFIIGTFACGFANSYELLIAARILAGGFGGLIGAQVLSIVADSFEFERRGRAMGVLMMAFAFASAIGVPTGLTLAQSYGWHAPFMIIGSLGLIIITLVSFYVPNMTGHIQAKQNQTKPLDVIRNIVANSNQKRALLLMITLMLAHFSIIPFIAPFMEFNIGFTKDQVTMIYFSGGIASMITGPLVGVLSDKYGKLKMFMIFSLLSIIPVYMITNMAKIEYTYVIAVTVAFFVFAGGRIIPAQAMITSVVHPQHRGGFMSINSSLQQLSTGMSALLAGFIVAKEEITGNLLNYHYVGYIGIALTFLCVYLASRVKAVA
jgi:MFS transporter, DHA1 family, inner membrane transport protein